jgi:uncharacterized protein (DUF1015 family)
MPDIAPFRGIVYDTSRVDLAKVIAPPYDVIDPAQRAALAADPHNCVRLILPEPPESEPAAAAAEVPDGRYAAAARTFDAWLADGTLRRDDYRCVYRYHQIFRSAELGDRLVTRKGLIASVRLHDFAEGVILPHERTLRGPKIDRLHLMKATSAHFSQIFTMYTDPAGETERIFRKAERRGADFDATAPDGVRHVIWRMSDQEAVGELRRFLGPRKLYIADGHHRYETMLALRDHFRAQLGGLSQYSQANYGTMFLANMDDPGLVVLPTHRIVHGLAGLEPDSFLEKARAFFQVDTLAGGARAPAELRAAIATSPNHQPTFAAVFPGRSEAYVLSLDPHVSPSSVGILGHSAVARLDVTLLHALVLEGILGIDAAAQEAQTNLRYVKDTAATLDQIAAGNGQVGFIMNPPRLDQIRAVADVGEVMPQKSTYFYPKLASGLVMNRLDPNADV